MEGDSSSQLEVSGAFVDIEDLGIFLSTLIPNLVVPDQFGIWPEDDLRYTYIPAGLHPVVQCVDLEGKPVGILAD